MAKVEKNIDHKIEITNTSLKALAESMSVFEAYKKKHDAQMVKIVRDSVIQRFEFSFDLFWKMLQTFLKEVEKVELTISSPRGIFRECVKIKVLTEDEGSICLEMLNNRNLTSHTYHEDTAEKVASKIPGFHQTMLMIAEKANRLK